MAASLLGYLNPMNYFANKEPSADLEKGEADGSVEQPTPMKLEEISSLDEPCKEEEKPLVGSDQEVPTAVESNSSLDLRKPWKQPSPQDNSDEPIKIRAQEETQHFPKPVVFDFCPGQRRMPYGQWWVPKGKTAAECTICEYCCNNCFSEVAMKPYLHKHFNMSGKYEGLIPHKEMKTTNCNCDCPKSEEHPKPKELYCPPCYFESIEVFGYCASLGTCRECKNQTSYSAMEYCPNCSYLLKACHMCCDTLKDGNSYIDAVMNKLDESIEQYEQWAQSDDDDKSYVKERIAYFNDKKEKVSSLLKDKSAEDILVMAKSDYKITIHFLEPNQTVTKGL